MLRNGFMETAFAKGKLLYWDSLVLFPRFSFINMMEISTG